MKISIYPGSFNPFHIGHNNIYWKAKNIFDKVYIVRGLNPNKPDTSLLDDFNTPKASLSFTYRGVLLEILDKLSKENKITISNIYTIRGIRNSKDYEYQSEQDYWLKQINRNFKSIYIECDEEYKHISSSAIKILKELNQPYKHLLI